jgi:hypothetical protein
MHTYVLLWSHDCTVETKYFQSERDDLNHLTFGGDAFESELNDMKDGEITEKEFNENHEGWDVVFNLIKRFEIDFEPYKEDILIDMVPDEIQVIDL